MSLYFTNNDALYNMQIYITVLNAWIQDRKSLGWEFYLWKDFETDYEHELKKSVHKYCINKKKSASNIK